LRLDTIKKQARPGERPSYPRLNINEKVFLSFEFARKISQYLQAKLAPAVLVVLRRIRHGCRAASIFARNAGDMRKEAPEYLVLLSLFSHRELIYMSKTLN
jgi:hypothetical protein